MAEHDKDGDGVADAHDPTDRGWGVPDAFRVRGIAAVPATAYRRGYCVWVTEPIPSPATVAAAVRLRERAARRGCASPAIHAAAAARRVHYLALKNVGVKARSAQVTGVALQFKLVLVKTARLKLEVLAGKKVIARGQSVRVKPAKHHGAAKTIKAKLNRAPAGTKLKLRLTAKVGKRTGQGSISVKLVNVVPSPCRADADSDGDGVSDCRERQGFDFKTYVPASQCGGISGPYACQVAVSRHVTSDPLKANTDDDATVVDGVTYQLSDGDEWLSASTGGVSDPSRRDSDDDGLTDVEEAKRWLTNANSPDSDLDSAHAGSASPPNPELFDGAEVKGGSTAARLPTSPTSADTDGDGISDLDEIVNGTISPLLADVSQYEIALDPTASVAISIGQTDSTRQEYALRSVAGSSDVAEDERNDETVDGTRDKIHADLTGEAGVEEKKDEAVPNGKATIGVGYEHEWSHAGDGVAPHELHPGVAPGDRAGVCRGDRPRDRPDRHAVGELRDQEPGRRAQHRAVRVGDHRALPVHAVAGDGQRLRGGGRAGSGPREFDVPVALRAENDDAIKLAAGGAKSIPLVAEKVDTATLKSIAANPGNLSFRVTHADVRRPEDLRADGSWPTLDQIVERRSRSRRPACRSSLATGECTTSRSPPALGARGAGRTPARRCPSRSPTRCASPA